MAIAIGLLKMLLELQQSRKTGAIDVSGPGARVRIFVENGDVVFADEGTVGETLGRILVRERVLTQEQYTAAVEWTSEQRRAGKEPKLGEVLVEMGLLTREQVYAALSAQVQQRVIRALAWTTAGVRFMEVQAPLAIAQRFDTPIEPLVVAALRLADREHIEELLAHPRDRFVALRTERLPGGGSTRLDTVARIHALQLPVAEDAFARTLDGSRTVGELLAEENVARTDRGVVLAALLLTDALDLLARPAAPPRVSTTMERVAVSALGSGSGSSKAATSRGAASKLAEIAQPMSSRPRVAAALVAPAAAPSSPAPAPPASAPTPAPPAASAPVPAPLPASAPVPAPPPASAPEPAPPPASAPERSSPVPPPRRSSPAPAAARTSPPPLAPLAPHAPARARRSSTPLVTAVVAVAGLAAIIGVRARQQQALDRGTESSPPAADSTPPVASKASTFTSNDRSAAADASLDASPGAALEAAKEASLDAAPAAPAASSPVAPAASAREAGASYASSDASLPSVDANKGVLVLPRAADGHRVYIDGRMAGTPPPPIVVTCGRRTVKIGSQGREQVLFIPCGGSLSVAYP